MKKPKTLVAIAITIEALEIKNENLLMKQALCAPHEIKWLAESCSFRMANICKDFHVTSHSVSSALSLKGACVLRCASVGAVSAMRFLWIALDERVVVWLHNAL